MRPLTAAEIHALEANRCRAADWSRTRVAADFSPARIFNAAFRGDNEIGAFNSPQSGLENATLTNCRVADNAQIRDSYLENYAVGENVKIGGGAQLAHDGKSGNDEVATVLREPGGYEIILHAELIAPLVWLECFASYDDASRARWRRTTAAVKKSAAGIIGANAQIVGGLLTNVAVGAGASIIGATKIQNGTINGAVGAGAIISRSVVAAGGYVGDGCQVEKCFVADGAILDRGFHADNSLFFADCDFQRGESSALFAAPFAVSHHQPSLLIAAAWSFGNAGSGANFSNHRYKLGPRHYGVFERGVKFGSNASILLPARIGMFTTVVGKHYAPLDTADFPFSLLVEENGQSVLLPGANLFSVGVERDNQKWRDRDRRRDKTRQLFHGEVWTPLTAGRIQTALDRLQNPAALNLSAGKIPAAYVATARRNYQMALDFYLGETLAKNAAARDVPDKNAPDDWLDVGGVIAPRRKIAHWLARFRRDEFADYAEMTAAIDEIYHGFAGDELAWAKRQLQITNYETAKKFRAEKLARDRAKEFAAPMKIGYDVYDADRAANFAYINRDA
ncbi:DUF4954 domain-containing protein [Planctomycetales bacterium]|nr:DUF4954 domain-containing protein [Planctomycetales bacterium]